MQMLRKYSNSWILLAGLLLAATAARAGNGGGQVKAIAVLDGNLHQIRPDSSTTVEDSAFFNPSYIGNLDSAYGVQNIVTLMINESSPLYLRTAFTETVKLRIIYTTATGAIDSTTRSFTINYDSAH